MPTRFKSIPMIPPIFRGREVVILSDVGRLEEMVTARVPGMAGLTMLFPAYWVEGKKGQEEEDKGNAIGNDSDDGF